MTPCYKPKPKLKSSRSAESLWPKSSASQFLEHNRNKCFTAVTQMAVTRKVILFHQFFPPSCGSLQAVDIADTQFFIWLNFLCCMDLNINITFRGGNRRAGAIRTLAFLKCLYRPTAVSVVYVTHEVRYL